MPREFEIPDFYRSPVISGLKKARAAEDPKKKDKSPSLLKAGPVTFKLARHFGLCYGVENAIERAYRALAENPGKRIFLLSEMIHNPTVNADLESRGIRFLQSPEGEELIPFEELSSDDIVIVPAFGTTVSTFERLKALGVEPEKYNTTCPFVERVWKRAAQLGSQGYSIIIHGKHRHEETRATFSHARESAESLILRDLDEARWLGEFILERHPNEEFFSRFKDRISEGFDPERSLQRVGVVNQTTMLATETKEISQVIRDAMVERYGEEKISDHFADTRDTLCYATAENQAATYALLDSGADLALVVGGYNSSNTSHLVELLQEQMPTFFVKGAEEILSAEQIQHLALPQHELVVSSEWLPAIEEGRELEIIVTAGASCPDALVERVIHRVCDLLGCTAELRTPAEPLVQIHTS